REIERGATEVGMALRHEARELSGRAADVAQRVIRGEVELLGEGREVARRDAAHACHELFEARGVAVELLEHRRARALELVLRLARLEAFAEITPEGVEPGVRHLEEPAHVAGAASIEEGGALRGVAVACGRPVPVPLEEAE